MKKLYTLAFAAAMALAANAQVYLVGSVNGESKWTPDTPVELTKNAAGDWTTTITTQTFKLSTTKGDWDTFNAGAFSVDGGNVTKEQVGTDVAMVAWGENTNMPWEGEWTITVKADYKTATFTTTTPEPTGFTKAYVVGDMTDWKFTDPKWEMVTTDGTTYTFECSIENETSIAAGVMFKVAAPNWTGINYSTGGEAIADGEANSAAYNVKGNIFFTTDAIPSGAFTGEIKLVLINGPMKEAELYFTYKAPAGVANVSVDNVAAEYFNLQGVRVAQPEAGQVYIVRRGASVSKVVK